VCQNYLETDGWKSVLINDEWKGKYAAGLTNSKNRGCKEADNP
jgi:hypothetical protein